MRFLVVMVLMMLILNACVTERVIVVEKEKSPNDEYIENFRNIVDDVASGGKKYIGETLTVRAAVGLVVSDLPPPSVHLRTGKRVAFTVYLPLIKEYKEYHVVYKLGLDYNFRVKISNIVGSSVHGYWIYAEYIEK